MEKEGAPKGKLQLLQHELPLIMKRRRDRPSLYSLLALVCLYGLVKAHGNEPVRDIGGSVLVPMPEPGPLGVKVKTRTQFRLFL